MENPPAAGFGQWRFGALLQKTLNPDYTHMTMTIEYVQPHHEH
jgi:hypothetical protein